MDDLNRMVEILQDNISVGLMTKDEAFERAVKVLKDKLDVKSEGEDSAPSRGSSTTRFNWRPYYKLFEEGKTTDELSKITGQDSDKVNMARYAWKKRQPK